MIKTEDYGTEQIFPRDNDEEYGVNPAEETRENDERLFSADELKALQNELNYQQRVADIQNEWKKQAAVIKNIVPDFDLETAFENSDFYDAVTEQRLSIAEAYPLLERQRRNIAEIGSLSGGVGGYVRRDVASMSDEEFDDYIKKIKNS